MRNARSRLKTLSPEKRHSFRPFIMTIQVLFCRKEGAHAANWGNMTGKRSYKKVAVKIYFHPPSPLTCTRQECGVIGGFTYTASIRHMYPNSVVKRGGLTKCWALGDFCVIGNTTNKSYVSLSSAHFNHFPVACKAMVLRQVSQSALRSLPSPGVCL